MARGFWGAVDGFAGGLAQGLEKGERMRLARQADERAQAEEDRRAKEAEKKEQFEKDQQKAARDGQYVYKGANFQGLTGYKTFEEANLPNTEVYKESTAAGEGMARGMALPAQAPTAPAGTPAMPPAATGTPPAPTAPTPQIGAGPGPASLPQVDPDVAIKGPAPATVPAGLPTVALPPPGQPADPADMPKAAVAAPTPPAAPAAAAPTEAKAQGLEPTAPVKEVVVQDPATGMFYRVPQNQTRERTPIELARDMYPVYAAHGRAGEGLQLITAAAQAQVAQSALDKDEMSTQLARSSINPAAFASTATKMFGDLKMDVDIKPVQVDVGDGKTATVFQFNQRGTDAPPFYIDRMGQLSMQPDPGSYNANVAMVVGMARGDTAAALTHIATFQGQVMSMRLNEQTFGQREQLFPLQLAGAQADIDYKQAQTGLVGAQTAQTEAQTQGVQAATSYNYGVEPSGTSSPRAPSSRAPAAGLPSSGTPAPSGTPTASGNYVLPVNGRMSSPWGPRSAPVKGASTYHRGIDFAVPIGTPVKAVADGVVLNQGWEDKDGNIVRVKHKDGSITSYSHLRNFKLRPGVEVKAGDVIAYSGQTGTASGPNMHLGYRRSAGAPLSDPSFMFNGGRSGRSAPASAPASAPSAQQGAPSAMPAITGPNGRPLSPRDQAAAQAAARKKIDSLSAQAHKAAGRVAPAGTPEYQKAYANQMAAYMNTADPLVQQIWAQQSGVQPYPGGQRPPANGNGRGGPPPGPRVNNRPAPAPRDDTALGAAQRWWNGDTPGQRAAAEKQANQGWKEIGPIYRRIEADVLAGRAPAATDLKRVRRFTDAFPFMVNRMNGDVVRYIAHYTSQ